MAEEEDLNEERAFASIPYKEKLADFLIEMHTYRAFAAANWGNLATKNFIISLTRLYGLLKYELIEQNKKIKNEEEKKAAEEEITVLDNYFLYGNIDPNTLTPQQITWLISIADKLTEVLKKMGITELKRKEGDPVRKWKKSYR